MPTEMKQDGWGEAFANLKARRKQEREKTPGYKIAKGLLTLDGAKAKIDDRVGEIESDTRKDMKKRITG